MTRETATRAAGAAATAATRVIKKVAPSEPGVQRWAVEYGDRLVCVRYRVDAQNRRRQTTVELIVDEAPTLGSMRVGVRVAWGETQLRQQAKEAVGKRDSSASL